MSIKYWPIVLYGVRCDGLKVKKEYCDEDIEQDDIWNFLCSFFDLFDDYGLVFSLGGEEQDEIYIGIPPAYTWDDFSPNVYKTKSDANRVIIDFIFRYFDIEMPEDDFIKKIDHINTCGWRIEI